MGRCPGRGNAINAGDPTKMSRPRKKRGYEVLTPSCSRIVDRLNGEFDALVARMQRPEFERAMERMFAATPDELGAAHRRGMKRRGISGQRPE